MNAHALAVLEFHQALEVIAAKAASPMGREAVLARVPATDAEAVRGELRRVAETQLFISDRAGWGMPPVPDARLAIERLALDGSVLEPIELHAFGVLLASSRALAREMDAGSESYPSLAPTRARLHEDQAIEETLARTVDEEGTILDTASKELKRIRGELRRAHSRIVQKLEGYARTLPERIAVADASVTIRDGRYVIPVRREGKNEVGGIIHDESATGGTVFVEPPIAIALMNELRDLEREEQREIRRILGQLTQQLAPSAGTLGMTLAALVDFDSLHARARAAIEWRGEAPEVLEPGSGTLVIEDGRHPLLLARAAGAEGDTEGDIVPFDLVLDPGERALVVSGPNTGGKSVFLKALGLIAALTQAGVVPPVRKGSRLPLFRDVFADIGDEQSIAGSLSTFSAHLENLKEIV
ncbi:MAG: endonuclease MutS2, partial [Gemmatimonadetes bacterium]|nr:endonuclease MutS2 [Gemmatimonadota bacterium]